MWSDSSFINSGIRFTLPSNLLLLFGGFELSKSNFNLRATTFVKRQIGRANGEEPEKKKKGSFRLIKANQARFSGRKFTAGHEEIFKKNSKFWLS